MMYEIGMAALWVMVWMLGFFITVWLGLFMGSLLYAIFHKLYDYMTHQED